MCAIHQLRELRLQLSPDFAITYDGTGQTIVYNFARPERCARISERIHLFLGGFSPVRATNIESATDNYCTRSGVPRTSELESELLSAANQLTNLGFLVRHDHNASMYTQEMVEHYLRSRVVPAEVCETVVRAASVGPVTRVLDVATGTGSVALHIAARSANVIGIDLCQPFLEAARQVARALNRKVEFRQGCGNRLVFQRSAYDLITVSQAFHWLDPVCAMRGFQNALSEGAFLCFIESKAVLPTQHPLRRLWGYGDADLPETRQEFERQAKAYSVRAHGVGKAKWKLESTGRWLFRQRRPFDADFARALFFSKQTTGDGGKELDGWKHLIGELAESDAESLKGDLYWQVIRFQKIPVGSSPVLCQRRVPAIRRIPYCSGDLGASPKVGLHPALVQ